MYDVWGEIRNLKAEVRRLRGRIDAVLVGNQVIPSSSLGGTVPNPIEGAIIRGNSTPEWERVAIGAEGEVLTVVGGEANWAAPDSTRYAPFLLLMGG